MSVFLFRFATTFYKAFKSMRSAIETEDSHPQCKDLSSPPKATYIGGHKDS